ncbi:MAG: DUF1385 domain-containing protein [Acidimicrobiales bacterium]|nr:DUF1385 domain-containing protein [Acidimicrobiales bacterium]MCB1015742.1 DUF1385 domain-containing protein [Acidimicrobiales bacterium]
MPDEPRPEPRPLDPSTPIGGQAVVEGVMMRGPHRWAVAARRPDGTIATTDEGVPTWAQKPKAVPVVRGAFALVETMALGLKALKWSAAVEKGDEDGAPATDRSLALTTVVTLVVFIAVFSVVPAAAAHAVADRVHDSTLVFVLAEGVLRLGLFLGYVVAIGRSPAIRRTYEYHGAEHMVIAAFEHAEPLTVEAARRYSTRHARCGTDFLLLVVVVAIVVFSLFGQASWPVLVLTRVVGLPVVAGLAYEILRLAKRRPESRLVKAVTAPGLALQALTTKPPADDQIEVAIASLEAVIAAEAATEASEQHAA